MSAPKGFHPVKEFKKGYHPPTEFKKGHHPANEFKLGHPAWNKGKKDPFEVRQKKSQAERRLVFNKPTELEKKLITLIKENSLPFRYVGNGEIWIGGKCPDFFNTNGSKQLIELFGIYWHPVFDTAKRIEHFRKYGFNTLVIWEDELDNKVKLIRKIRKFAKLEKK